ncbi:MAG TPA: hypothetical protein VGX75_12425 [bacterium]|nr:hypothetical protein [bacterium]
MDRRRVTGAAGLLSLQLQLGSAFGTAVLATMLENGLQRYHALLAAHATPTNPVYAQYARQLAALAASRTGDSVAAQQNLACL